MAVPERAEQPDRTDKREAWVETDTVMHASVAVEALALPVPLEVAEPEDCP